MALWENAKFWWVYKVIYDGAWVWRTEAESDFLLIAYVHVFFYYVAKVFHYCVECALFFLSFLLSSSYAFRFKPNRIKTTHLYLLLSCERNLQATETNFYSSRIQPRSRKKNADLKSLDITTLNAITSHCILFDVRNAYRNG